MSDEHLDWSDSSSPVSLWWLVPSLERDPSIPSSTSGDNDDNDASSSDFDDEMTSSQ